MTDTVTGKGNIVRELPQSTRASQTFDVQMGDLIKCAGFTFRVGKGNKLDHSLNRKPAFIECDGAETVAIWECDKCKAVVTTMPNYGESGCTHGSHIWKSRTV